MGTISYEFYLVHQFMLERLAAVLSNRVAALFLALGVTLIVSALLFEGVQRPFERLLSPRRRGLLVRISLVGASALALLGFSLPRPLPPVRNAVIMFSGTISRPGVAAEHITGEEAADFSTSQVAAAGTFRVSSGGQVRVVEERALDGVHLVRLSQPGARAVSSGWASGALAPSFTGRSDDDPSNLLAHLRALGVVEVLAPARGGPSATTTLRIRVVPERLSLPERRSFALALGGACGRCPSLTLWLVVDRYGLVRQLRYRDDLADGRGHLLATVSVRYLFTRFNEVGPAIDRTPPDRVVTSHPAVAAPPSQLLFT